jgi:8-oxo-dGTP diphosphatase
MKPGKDYIGVGIGLLIQNDKGEFLFGKRGPASKNEKLHWEIPGGAVEYGDTLANTAIREAREELGVDIEIVAQCGAIDHFIPKDGHHWVAVTFLCRIKPGQAPRIMEPEKCIELRWCKLNKLPAPLSTATAPTIKAYKTWLVSQTS